MEEEKLRAVYYARCSTEEENQKDALVRQAAEAEGLSVLDLWRVYQAEEQSGGEPFQADPLHPNERGYGIAARAVARAMNSD